MEFKETASGKLPLGSAGLPSILRKQLVCALAYQLFLHFLVRLVVKYHTFKDDLLWFYTFLRTFFDGSKGFVLLSEENKKTEPFSY